MNELGKSVRHIMTVFIFLFVALISYMAYFQVFKAPSVAEDSRNPRLWIKRNEVLRGTIYDRNGNALTESKRIDEYSQSRTYLGNDLFVHAIGYINEEYGLTGLEEEYDKELSTCKVIKNNFRSFLDSIKVKDLLKNMKSDKSSTGSVNCSDNFKQFIDDIEFKRLVNTPEQIGNGVITTIDSELQRVAYDALGSEKGSVVAINPKTGEILAMVSKPTYNPNALKAAMEAASSGDPENTPLINRAIDGLYPPGSVFKTVTLASALENIPGVEEREFNDTGKIEFQDGRTLNNYAYQSHGGIELQYGYRV